MKLDLTRLLAIIVIIIAIVYFNLNIFAPKLIPNSLKIGILRKPTNILIIGTDITYDAVTRQPIPQLDGRADTILLAHVNPMKARINLLSIPRDTMVEIPDYGFQKINTANVFGGADLVKESVTKLTNQKIDYYLEMKPGIMSKLVNWVGGVTLFVEKDMRYTDKAQDLDINLTKGWQKLSGKDAHDYIRFRYDIEGDIARIRRQQKFFRALTKSIAKPSNIVKAPFAVPAVLAEIKTDLPLNQTIRFLNLARMSTITAQTISGEGVMVRRLGSVWKPDVKIMKQQIEELF